MVTRVSKSKFKARALAYMRHVQKSGQEIIITDRGRPACRLCPIEEQTAEEILASLRGSVIEYIDPEEPVGLEDWEALR
jgi:prevent-host-death family protein